MACDTMPVKRQCLMENREVGNVHSQRQRFSVLIGMKKGGLISGESFRLLNNYV